MNFAVPVISVLVLVFGIYWVTKNKTFDKQKNQKSDFSIEYRTDLAFDECLDALNIVCDTDVFAYDLTREASGNFVLHFTLHKKTMQPIDTLYSMRIDSGKQTVISLVFLREAFGYKEPVFPSELLDEFFAKKISATRTK